MNSKDHVLEGALNQYFNINDEYRKNASLIGIVLVNTIAIPSGD